MIRPLFAVLLLLSSYIATISYGFVLRPHRSAVSKTYKNYVPSILMASAISPLEEVDDDDEALSIRSIIDIDSNNIGSDNIDDVRRARSLARRDRLQQTLAAAAEEEEEGRDTQDNFFLIAAFLPAIIAFVSWEGISFGLSEFLDMVGVVGTKDGNYFSNNLLRPTITGVVVPVISIALATLVSTTVNVLRQRQVDLRAHVNKEACELRLLRRAVFGMYGTRQHAGRRARALALMCGYVDQLITECEEGAVDVLEELQLNGGIAFNELDQLSAMLHGIDGASAARQGSVSAADDLIVSLNGHRSDRVATLLSVFPDIHWGILAGLSVSIIFAFLLTSNQQVLQYLNSIQLRFMFATIVGVCSGTATLCYDLSTPFSGTFSISGASTQLADIKVYLQEDVREAIAESREISSSARKFFRSVLGGTDVSSPSELSRRRSGFCSGDECGAGEEDDEVDLNPSSRYGYGFLSTLYFHLLTGPLGGNVRLIGDTMAWITTFLGRRLRAIVNWRRWPWRRKNEQSSREKLP